MPAHQGATGLTDVRPRRLGTLQRAIDVTGAVASGEGAGEGVAEVDVADGVEGAANGVTARLALEAMLAPRGLRAPTEKVYATPFCRPGTISGPSAPVTLCPPGDAVTV